MKNLIPLFFLLLLFSCTNNIKNEQAQVTVEPGAQVPPTTETKNINQSPSKTPDENSASTQPEDFIGFWVGYFEKDTEDYDKNLYIDEGFMWNRENKINLSIDKIVDGQVIGHSVVAGNDRPFSGAMKREVIDNIAQYSFEVKEPGDDRYDGVFKFTITGNELTGKWVAYKNIDIKKRKYTLKKRAFAYDSKTMLEQTTQYVDWSKEKQTKETIDLGEEEFEEWITSEFATATNLIYSINASDRLLTKTEVENLKKGDLTIIRNTIYARHGYSFKNRPLRVFFDAQNWYIPVHADIKKDFTDLEKENIQLLLRYEKNAAEYYDSFGRG